MTGMFEACTHISHEKELPHHSPDQCSRRTPVPHVPCTRCVWGPSVTRFVPGLCGCHRKGAEWFFCGFKGGFPSMQVKQLQFHVQQYVNLQSSLQQTRTWAL